MAVAAVTGLIAKENVVATFGMLYGFAEVAEDGAEIWGNLAGSHDTDRSLWLPGIQPSLCSLLRSYGCDQERDEQYKMVFICNRISVWTCISCVSVYLSDRYTGYRRRFRYLDSGCVLQLSSDFYICCSDLIRKAAALM